jgi:hypothetical protein
MAEMTWANEVAQLAGMRTKAETSAAVIKKFGGSGHVARGLMIYSDAKAEVDAVIAGLIVALSAKGQPERLSSLEERVEQAVIGLAKLRNMAESQIPKLEGMKSFGDILRGEIEPLMHPLSDAVAALYNNYRAEDELTRKTMQTRLEAARWLDFAQVRAASDAAALRRDGS